MSLETIKQQTLRSHVLTVIAMLAMAGAITGIVVSLDQGSTDTITSLIRNVQSRTLANTASSIEGNIMMAVPLLKFMEKQALTGLEECTTFDSTTLRFFFEDQIRMLMTNVAQYVYISTQYGPKLWMDCNCGATASGGMICYRPTYSSTANTYLQQSYVANNFPVDVTSTPTTPPMESNMYAQDYITSIRQLGPKDGNGSWSIPYYYQDDVTHLVSALQTLSIPIRFKSSLCTKAVSVDVNLKDMSKILLGSRAHDTTTIFVVDVTTKLLISTSDQSLALWDDQNQLYPADSYPHSDLIRTSTRTYYSDNSMEELINQPEGVFTTFSIHDDSMLVATRTLRDRNLHWVVFDVTPRNTYYGTVESSRANSIAIGASVGTFAFALTLFVFIVNTKMHSNTMKTITRDVTYAPNRVGETKGKMALIFTDIQGSTKLWDGCPEAMQQAVKIHHEVIREQIYEHHAYEVKTIGDSFMIATTDATTAVKIANSIQIALMAVPWDPNLCLQEGATNMYVDSRAGSGPMMFHGIRVRAGVHYGTPTTVWDEVAKGYDYYGDCVNTAARVESVAYGGQTVISEATLIALEKEYLENECQVRHLGSRKLKGVSAPVMLYEVLPKNCNLSKRSEYFAFIAQEEANEKSPENSPKTIRAPMTTTWVGGANSAFDGAEDPDKSIVSSVGESAGRTSSGLLVATKKKEENDLEVVEYTSVEVLPPGTVQNAKE
eukprot:PhF_6_TR26337/c3_g1_i1/m.37886